MTTSRSSRSADSRLIAALLACALALPFRATAAPTAKTEYEEGVRQYAADHFADAAAAFERAYALAPRPLILFNIGQCRRKTGDFDRALEAYKKYILTAGASERPETIAEARTYIVQIEAYKDEQRAAAQHGPTPDPTPPPPAIADPYVQPPPPTPAVVLKDAPPRRPLYKSPALWGGVGAGAAVILALGLGLGLGLRPHDPDTSLGTRSPDFHQ